MASSTSTPSAEPSSTHASLSMPADVSLAEKILEEYSHIPSPDINSHTQTIIAKTFQHPDPHPCITTSRFLQFEGSQHPLFPSIVARLAAPGSEDNLPDVGCCFGQYIRMYAFNGVPHSNLYGTDLYHEFLELGYELFNDRDRFRDHFIGGDIFTPHGKSKLDRFEGKMDIITATAFLHLFSWEVKSRLVLG